ncbi:hypothetical protein TrST_g4224 [Triparma strigata]|uniref:Cytosolic carboxypeptidase-like protein 5 n=1 Tax=Triparma strigata TaxID=1606541 RepID=A0A9W7DRY7_9STRA|nr:hypothetical protein TrST_g4224 [Triparma strigata]
MSQDSVAFGATTPASLPKHVCTPFQTTKDVCHLKFSSEFDSGNLKTVKFNQQANEFCCYQTRDAQDTVHEAPYTTWFHFSVEGAKPGEVVKFAIMNMNKQLRLYKQEYRPFYKVVPTSATDESAFNNWQRLPNPASGKPIPDENMMQLRFKFKFDSHFLGQMPRAEGDESCGFKVYFAFCYPQSYVESQTKLMQLEARTEELKSKDIYFHRELLTQSLDKRRIDMITISSLSDREDRKRDQPMHFTPRTVPESGAENFRAHKFSYERKKIVFVSSRVHPGETPAQFVWDGFLNLLLSDDCRAVQLRSQYVFKMVPMLNPDGVARGHYRTDTRGCNLNRFYDEPTLEAHPSIYAVKSYLTSQKQNLKLYLDLHAHASKRGCFIYGNHLGSCERQLANQLYVKCISLNSPWFEYKGCDFSRKGMSGKDKRDNGLTKEGSGRVGIFNATGCTHCYTLECNYNEGLGTNQVGSCTGVNFPEGSAMANLFGESPINGYEGMKMKFDRYVGNPSRMTTPKYNREMFCNVGEGCAIALLDMAGSNPLSRLGGTVPTTNPSRGVTLASSNWIGVVNEIKHEITRKRGEWEDIDQSVEIDDGGGGGAGKENQFAERWLDSGDCPMWKWAGDVQQWKQPERRGSMAGQRARGGAAGGGKAGGWSMVVETGAKSSKRSGVPGALRRRRSQQQKSNAADKIKALPEADPALSSAPPPRPPLQATQPEQALAKATATESPMKCSQYVLEKDRTSLSLPPASGSSPKVGPGLGSKQIFRTPQKGARSSFLKPGKSVGSSSVQPLPPGPASGRYKGLLKSGSAGPRQGFGGENLW